MASDEPEQDADYEAKIAAARQRHGFGNVARSTEVRGVKEKRLRRLTKHSNGDDERWTIRCQAANKDRITRLASVEGSSISSLMDEAMEMLLAAREKQGGGL